MKKVRSINRAISRNKAELRNLGTIEKPIIALFVKPSRHHSTHKSTWYRIS